MLVQRSAEASGLMLDPVAETFYLMDLAVDRVLPWTEAAGLLRGQGAGLLARGDASPQELAQFAGRIALVEEQALMARVRVEALERAGGRRPAAFTAAEDGTRLLLEAARAGFTQGKPQGEPTAWFAQGTRAIEAVVALEKEVNSRLVAQLTERAATLNRQRWMGLGFALAGLLAFAWAGAAFYRSTLIALHQVERVVRAGAEGDLTQHARVPGSDEFAGMAQSLSAMSRQLGGLVGAIRDTAAQVSVTGERIADDSRDLSDRTSRQAASVEESAATLEQVAQTVRQNGQNVEQVDRLFQQVQSVVQAGGERMRAVVGTMEQIEGTSRRVGEIITVIDGIAFQTNILALNAAVEAARAGEAGRGFAVVAAEVRTLAQRSASAAAEIRQLIQASGAQVGQGVAQIHGTRDTLAGLGEQVGMVAQALDQLATATREQTDAVAQVSEAVRQIDETTQGNARSVEAAAANAAALREQADHLQALVGRLKVVEAVERV
jgi:methyl-accepting chemotaxis protein